MHQPAHLDIHHHIAYACICSYGNMLIFEMSTDYKQLYESKCKEFDELNEVFNEYQEQSTMIIDDLQLEIKEIKKKNESMSKELNEMKEKRKNFHSSMEREIDQTKKEREQFRQKFIEFEKKVIELQNTNETLESDLRATKAVLNEYETRTEKTMEELALLQTQMEETTESNQEQIARLRSQLKQTEDQLFALHHAKQIRDDTKGCQYSAKDDSFHSHKDPTEHRSSITDSKMKKKSKFSETLSEIRNYIQEISQHRQELDKKFDWLV